MRYLGGDEEFYLVFLRNLLVKLFSSSIPTNPYPLEARPISFACKTLQTFFFTVVFVRNYTTSFWTSFWHYKYGNCFVFNRGEVNGVEVEILKSNNPGPSQGEFHKRLQTACLEIKQINRLKKNCLINQT